MCMCMEEYYVSHSIWEDLWREGKNGGKKQAKAKNKSPDRSRPASEPQIVWHWRPSERGMKKDPLNPLPTRSCSRCRGPGQGLGRWRGREEGGMGDVTLVSGAVRDVVSEEDGCGLDGYGGCRRGEDGRRWDTVVSMG